MIKFYSMDGCGFCQKSKQLFAKEIQSGMMVVVPASKAPKGVRGFPHFVNDANGKQHSGYPGTKKVLFEKLEVVEGYQSGAREGYQSHYQACQTCSCGDYTTLCGTWLPQKRYQTG
jgi:hypothetical protein